MDASNIVCPQCHHQFPINDAIEGPIVQRLQAEYQQKAAAHDAAIQAKQVELAQREQQLKTDREQVQREVEQKLQAERKKIIAQQEQQAREAVRVQLADLQTQLDEKNKKLSDANAAQLQLLREKRELDDKRQAFEIDKAKQIEAEREKIRADARQAAMEQGHKQIQELMDRLSVKEKKLIEAEQQELALRQEKAEFEESKRAFELELARRTDVAREIVRKEKDEEFRLKESEANQKLEGMKRQLDDLKRKLEQGSQQTQGEVLELDLETALKRCFCGDEIAPVAKGAHGGDILQRVRGDMGCESGTIIWELKRTKAWSDGWLTKLKDDKLAAKAQLAVLITVVMPKDCATFECREGVWIAPPSLAVPLAAALRLSLIETASARRAFEGRHDKVEVVYAYLSGPEFKGRVSAIVEAFTNMREDLEAEKKAIQKLWAKREKQIERVLANTAGMYGDLSGIIGQSLPAIDQLELGALTNESAEPLAAEAN